MANRQDELIISLTKTVAFAYKKQTRKLHGAEHLIISGLAGAIASLESIEKTLLESGEMVMGKDRYLIPNPALKLKLSLSASIRDSYKSLGLDAKSLPSEKPKEITKQRVIPRKFKA